MAYKKGYRDGGKVSKRDVLDMLQKSRQAFREGGVPSKNPRKKALEDLVKSMSDMDSSKMGKGMNVSVSAKNPKEMEKGLSMAQKIMKERGIHAEDGNVIREPNFEQPDEEELEMADGYDGDEEHEESECADKAMDKMEKSKKSKDMSEEKKNFIAKYLEKMKKEREEKYNSSNMKGMKKYSDRMLKKKK